MGLYPDSCRYLHLITTNGFISSRYKVFQDCYVLSTYSRSFSVIPVRSYWAPTITPSATLLVSLHGINRLLFRMKHNYDSSENHRLTAKLTGYWGVNGLVGAEKE